MPCEEFCEEQSLHLTRNLSATGKELLKQKLISEIFRNSKILLIFDLLNISLQKE